MIPASEIDAGSWLRIRRPIHERLYEVIVDAIDCGPFDGGCVAFAQALQHVVGGNVCVIVRADGVADHAVVHFDGRLWDWDGPDEPDAMIRRFNDAEHALGTGWRPIREGDLPGAPRDDALSKVLASLLTEVLIGRAETASHA